MTLYLGNTPIAGGGSADQTYDATSTNAQSGVAVAQAIADTITTSDLATCHVVVETYHSGANWYRVYSDGWCEQGGQISNLTTTVVTISLQKHFVDTNYSISMTQCVENATGQFAYIRNAPTTSSIDIKANSGTINKVYWEAKGYIS